MRFSHYLDYEMENVHINDTKMCPVCPQKDKYITKSAVIPQEPSQG